MQSHLVTEGMCQACKGRMKSALRSWLNIRGALLPNSPSPLLHSIWENNNRPESPNHRNIPTIARERGEELSRSVEAINYTEQKLKTQRDQRIRMQRYAGLQAMDGSTVLWSRPQKCTVWKNMDHDWEHSTTSLGFMRGSIFHCSERYLSDACIMRNCS